jgi:hypothetical protein
VIDINFPGRTPLIAKEIVMGVAEKVQHYVEQLPPPLQAEALDFVEYLVAKAEHEEAKNWSELSLTSAMRGVEDETDTAYEMSDLKELFR